jgi:hypothetical protein
MAKVVSHISPTHPLFREVMACAFSSDEQAALSMATGKALNYKLQGALEAAACS